MQTSTIGSNVQWEDDNIIITTNNNIGSSNFFPKWYVYSALTILLMATLGSLILLISSIFIGQILISQDVLLKILIGLISVFILAYGLLDTREITINKLSKTIKHTHYILVIFKKERVYSFSSFSKIVINRDAARMNKYIIGLILLDGSIIRFKLYPILTASYFTDEFLNGLRSFCEKLSVFTEIKYEDRSTSFDLRWK